MNLQHRISEIFRAAQHFGLSMDYETALMLAMNAAIAAGASGGKDSSALGIVLNRFLKEINHRGPKILIHSDLGLIEHADSLPACRRRVEIESEIPDELLYEKGWPLFQPNKEQSALIADVRRRIGEFMQLPVKYRTWRGVYGRYAELLDLKAKKELEKLLKKLAKDGRAAKAAAAGLN